LFKDNVLDIQQAHIEALESLLDINDKLLSDLGIVHISLKDIDLNVIISTMIEQKKRQFYSERKGLLLEE
jgi:mevalonate kinase